MKPNMRIDKSMRIPRRWAIINLVAALLTFLMLTGLCVNGMKMARIWKSASKTQEKMSKFVPTTSAEQGMKTLLLHSCWVTRVQRAEFFLLATVGFAFGFFGLYSFIIIRKLIRRISNL
ncbi:hypothetical protein KAI19_02635 [bacterium]|nr:hypothetical protein [bacterium]